MTRDEFSAIVKRQIRERDRERCSAVLEDGTVCGSTEGLIFEHLIPTGWLGGKGTLENGALRCRDHAKEKTAIEAGQRARSNRLRAKHEGIAKPARVPVRGSKAHPLYERDRARILQERQRKREKGRA